MRRRTLLFLLALASLVRPFALIAQAAPVAAAQSASLRVFNDCQTMGCDDDFFMTEIPFVSFTRDRTDAEVHMLVRSLSTGAGGQQYTVTFIGLQRFAGRADTLVTSIPPNTTSDGARRELARIFKLGLVRYVATTEAASRLKISYEALSAADSAGKKPAIDPWNFWVYRVGASGNVNGQSQSKSNRISADLSARRTTADLKLSFSANSSYRESKYSFDDGTSSAYFLRSHNASARIVKSIDQHWSWGANLDAGLSDFSNQSLFVRANVSAEYNVFPWTKATEKQLVAIYAVGAEHYRYQEQTIYFLDQETRPRQQLILAGTTRQPWGSLDVQARASQYLHDGSKQNLSVSGFTDVRLSRGLSLNLFAYASRVRDQLFIAAGELSKEDVLTQQRALATSYEYGMSIGISYTFGSILNAVVNPRLDNLNGGGSFFFF